MNVEDLPKYIKENNMDAIKEIMAKENLEIVDGKIRAKDKVDISAKAEYWGQIQLVRKIQLNSLYGAVTNPHSEFFDKRLGQSCTLSGRCTTRHMGSVINEKIVGKYELGDSLIGGDTDSLFSFATIKYKNSANLTEKPLDCTIEGLYNLGSNFWKNGEKEYSLNDDIKILHYDHKTASLSYVNYNYVYRHKVKNKPKFTIKTENHKSVTVTGDHSIMVLENNILVEKKPKDLRKGDLVVTVGI